MLEKIKNKIIGKLVPEVYVLTTMDVDYKLTEDFDKKYISEEEVKIKSVMTAVMQKKQSCYNRIFDYIDYLNAHNIRHVQFTNVDNPNYIIVLVLSTEESAMFYIATHKYQ